MIIRLSFFLLLPFFAFGSDKVYIQYSHLKNESELKTLSKDFLPNIRWFRNNSDFINEVNIKKPGYLITSKFIKVKNYNPLNNVTIHSNHQFLILTNNPKWNKNNLHKATVAVVDEVGRKKIRTYLNNIFNIQFRRIRRITKPHDLYPLLALQTVDVIVIREIFHASLKQKYKLNTFTVHKAHLNDSYQLYQRSDFESLINLKKLNHLTTLFDIGHIKKE